MAEFSGIWVILNTTTGEYICDTQRANQLLKPKTFWFKELAEDACNQLRVRNSKDISKHYAQYPDPPPGIVTISYGPPPPERYEYEPVFVPFNETILIT